MNTELNLCIIHKGLKSIFDKRQIEAIVPSFDKNKIGIELCILIQIAGRKHYFKSVATGYHTQKEFDLAFGALYSNPNKLDLPAAAILQELNKNDQQNPLTVIDLDALFDLIKKDLDSAAGIEHTAIYHH